MEEEEEKMAMMMTFQQCDDDVNYSEMMNMLNCEWVVWILNICFMNW